MSIPSKCKNCKWYGKPYWSIINPCDNCPRENTNVEILTRWQDPTIEELKHQLQQKENIIKEVRKYITSYESIETIQQFDHNKNNKDLDYSTIDEMTRRYMIVHDKILEILDKGE